MSVSRWPRVSTPMRRTIPLAGYTAWALSLELKASYSLGKWCMMYARCLRSDGREDSGCRWTCLSAIHLTNLHDSGHFKCVFCEVG
ncbi:hypothetical protein SERLA73DRAFT_183626 [Serpula lacrymans var. lacrymans S7.3]|uniref:Uncharacterized protein n=2 Tax=Serpula lacrymans var. lacrymans TaxID=341189 RepID=F8Q0B1_SERL3|nr:uncharacterized protein SERLADRAFT_470908 [Serpula lacrymans var. lacrymans S7.9]EGN98561.1 hypothetical protein SERLA73DRAFT_183626 [Serpula lacrymans var. lacrymans S7.3]EGO24127.1 hypothetical protein SERLADRAFT_470908 [Serpula lacrymans var. lacrymans S7.9]